MKQSDIFTIIIIATIGTLAAFFGVNYFLGNPDDKSVTFSTINPISASLTTPDPELFNPEAINPTVEVYVGECEDKDHNGILSTDELKSCGKLQSDDTSSTGSSN